LSILLVLAACSTTQDNPDPHKEFNQDMLDLNLTLDENLLKPTAEGYKAVSNEGARDSISNFFNNLKEPYYLVNYVLSGDAEYAANSLFRFVVNSTFGILGLFDVAQEMGLDKNETSHKTTLKKWGIPTGDYLVLPIFNASSTRDAIAEPVSWFMDPVGYVIGPWWMAGKFVASAISDRAENGKIYDSVHESMSPYSMVKSFYEQKYGDDASEEDNSEDEDSEDQDSSEDPKTGK
jgi:phospholipid-binding lipoprotein MlaA